MFIKDDNFNRTQVTCLWYKYTLPKFNLISGNWFVEITFGFGWETFVVLTTYFKLILFIFLEYLNDFLGVNDGWLNLEQATNRPCKQILIILLALSAKVKLNLKQNLKTKSFDIDEIHVKWKGDASSTSTTTFHFFRCFMLLPKATASV